MPWNEVKVEDQRKLFTKLLIGKNYSMSELCRQFGISRQTGYKWLNRFIEEGPLGLQDRSKAPLMQPGRTPPNLERGILEVKYKYPNWGPKKVKAYLEIEMPDHPWPSKTTIGAILQKHGLTKSRKLRRRFAERTDPLFDCNESNDTWCLDFKGWFMTKDQYKCGPFTLMDAHSRFLLSCINLNVDDTNHVWAVLDRCFREYGLPSYIRSDNGPPFATTSVGRLSKLSVNIIKAGIIPEWIDPGKPQQNGRHERMHLTLKQEGIYPHQLTLEEQQMKFDEFIDYYNFIRPHEALDQKRPGDIYQQSPRQWNGRLHSPEYPDGYKVGKVASCGKTCWKGKSIYIGRVLAGEPVGIVENSEGIHVVFYGPIMLGKLDGDELKFTRRKSRRDKNKNDKY